MLGVVTPLERPLTDWKDVAERISQVQGVRLAVDGPALASSSNASGVLVRGIRAADLNQIPSIAGGIKHGLLETSHAIKRLGIEQQSVYIESDGLKGLGDH